MILLPLLILLAIVAGVGVFIASLLRSDGDDPGRTIGRLAPIGLALGVGVVALVVVEGVLVFGLRGLGGSDGEDASDAAPDTTTTVVAVEPEPARDAIAADVEMTLGGAGFEPPPVLSGVDDGGVLVVRASSFPNDSRGTISWCDERGCHDQFPVQFDGDGGALVQYELDVPDGSCRRARQCALRIDSDDGAATAALFVGVSAPTVPRARLAHPGRELQPGDAIALELVGVGFDSVNVLGCRSDAEDIDGCYRLAFEGESSVIVPARTARLVVVDSRTGLAVAEPIAIEVVRIRPEYESARVILGVALGLALLTVAWALLRNTDWREPVAAIPWTD